MVGLWYSKTLGRMCVGGPAGSKDLGKDLCAWVVDYCRETIPPEFRVPFRIQGGHRWRRTVPITRKQFNIVVAELMDPKFSELGIGLKLVGPVRRFGRLCN